MIGFLESVTYKWGDEIFNESKLSTKYVYQYKILKRVFKVEYELELSTEL